MADKERHNREKNPIGSSSVYVASILIVFIVGIMGAIGWYLYRQHSQQQVLLERQRNNEKLGLSLDFPSDRVPIYDGLKLLETERGTAKAKTGEPMYKWYVHGEIDEDKDVLYEFYHNYFMDSGMQQTQYVSIPTGYGIDYADETMSVEVVIEYRKDSDLLQVEITAYRLQ